MAEATQRWPTITGAIQPLLRVQGELLFETRPTYVARQYADAVHSVISPRNFREEMHKVNDVFQKRGPRQDMRYVSSWAPIGCGIALAIAGLLGTLNDALLYVGIALTCAGVLLTLHFVRDKKHRLQRGLDDIKAHLEKELNPRMAAAGLTYSLGSFTYTASGVNAAGEHYKVEQTNHYITVIPSAALLEAHRLRPSASSSSAAAQRSAAAGHANADAALARAVAAATGQGQQLSHEQQQQQLGGPGSAAGSMVSLDSYWRLQVDCESVPDPTGLLDGPGSASSSAPATSRAWMSSQLDLASLSMTVDGGGNGNSNGGGLGFIVPSSTRSQGSGRRSSNPPLPASFEFQLSHHTHGAGGQQQLVLPGGSAAAAAGTSAGAGTASGTAVQALQMRQPIFFTMLATPTLTGMPGPGHGPSASASTVPAAAGFRFLNPLHAHTPPTGTANGAGSGGSVPAIATAGGGTAGNTNTPTQLVTPIPTAGAPISLAALLLARGAASGLGGPGGGAVPPPLILNSSSSPSSRATLPAGTVASVSSPLILPPSSTSTLNLMPHTPAPAVPTPTMSPLLPPMMPPLLLGLPATAAAATSAASSAPNSDGAVGTPNINGIEFQSSTQPAMSAPPFSLQLQPFRARDSPLARQLHAQLAERSVPASASNSGTPTLTPRNRAPAHSPALAAITGISSLSPVVLAWSAPPDHDVAASVNASDGDPT